MLKQLQQLGMAIAVPFTMATTVAVAQCPTMSSLNLSTGPNGAVYGVVNMSSSILPGKFSIERTRVSTMIPQWPSSFTFTNTPFLQYISAPNIIGCEGCMISYSSILADSLAYTKTLNGSILTFTYISAYTSNNSNSNGESLINVVYMDTVNSCISDLSGSVDISNLSDSTNSCPNFYATTGHGWATGLGTKIREIAFYYTGGSQLASNINVSANSGCSYTVTGNSFLYDASVGSACQSYTATLVTPLDTICSPDQLIGSLHTNQANYCHADASFVMFMSDTINGVYVLYDHSSALGNISWLWDFGDGNTSTLQYPSHTYSVSGFYNVCSTVSSSDSLGNTCSDTQCMWGGFKVSNAGNMTKIVVKNPNSPTSIDEQKLVSTLLAYPNPVADELTIEINADANFAYTITDALGKVVSQNKLTDDKTVINTSNLNNGFYVLSILNEKENVLKTQKLVK